MEMEINRKIYCSVVQENANKIRYLKAFGEGNRFGVMYITFEDEVYGVGYNGDFNLLGVSGDNFLRKRLENPAKVSRLCGKGIQHVCLGDHLAIGLGADGELYKWGLPYSQMRSCYDRNSIQLPHLMTGCTHVVSKLDCGGGFFAVTTNHKKVFMWGYIDWSAPFSDGRLFSPMHKEVVDIACGTWHIIMLTADGKPYSCGHGGYGQLGYDWSESNGYWRIEKIQFNEPCVKIAAGSVSSFIITASGELYAFGLNHVQFGFLGVDSEEPAIKRPIRVRIDGPVNEVATSYSLATLRNVYAANFRDGSKLYKWGWGCESRWPQVVNGVTNLKDVFESLPTPPLHCGNIMNKKTQKSSDTNKPIDRSVRSQCSVESSQCETDVVSSSEETWERERRIFQKTSKHLNKLTLNNLKSCGEFNKNTLHSRNDKVVNKSINRSSPSLSKLELCEQSAYKTYLDYVYGGGNEDLTFTELLDVHVLAIHYEETQLIEYTLEQIRDRLSPSTLLIALGRSRMSGLGNLKELCEHFITDLCKNPDEVVKLITSISNSPGPN